MKSAKEMHEAPTQDDLVSMSSDFDDDDDDSHDTDSNNGGGTVTGTEKGMSEEESYKLELAKKETAAVLRLRLLVFLILLLAAVAVSVIVYFVTANGEDDAYQVQFSGAADKIKESFIEIAESKLSALMTLAVAIIAHGQDHDTQYWPYVTLSSFQQRSSTARKQSGALYVHINPKINEREDWENFVVNNPDSSWMDRGMAYQERVGLSFVNDIQAPRPHHDKTVAPWPVWYYNATDEVYTDDTEGPWFPTWQSSPLVYQGDETNENILANKDGYNAGANITFHSNSVAISQLIISPPGGLESRTPSTHLISLLMSIRKNDGTLVDYMGDPVSKVYFPVYDSFDEDRKPVALLLAWIQWGHYFEKILNPSLRGVYLVLKDCQSEFTYVVNGAQVVPLGQGDLHPGGYDNMKESIDFSGVNRIADGTEFGIPLNKVFCPISLDIYPSKTFEESFGSNTPAIMTAAVAIVFAFTAFMFVIYDRLVERRQTIVMKRAAQTNAIVTSLFPENVRDRLMNQAAAKLEEKNFVSQNRRLKGYLNGGADDSVMGDTPIADLFPECTVMFADISGFTAWSSTRDPAQVFILLQSVYQAFDKIAKRRKVFKVETIGDSYVAVTGLPEPQPNHAVIMARFAGECRIKMNELTNHLEKTLGPDTGDLSMRFGLHSGPVTAGVLQGERARFQLFGDTVNTAARMESTGIKNRIQISPTTYERLEKAGRSSWTKPRLDEVHAKGKGTMKTYWLDPRGKKASSQTGSSSGSGDTSEQSISQRQGVSPSNLKKAAAKTNAKQERLVDWMVDLLKEHIKKHLALRRTKAATTSVKYTPAEGKTSLDEVAEVISLPRFCEETFAAAEDHRRIVIDSKVMAELQDYVATIASHYHSNPFHNFEHACHVTMATNKLLKRIVAPDIAIEKAKSTDIASELHDYTHGINSDPLALLAIVFSALIHDVDHRGVSNLQLATEDKELSEKYGNKSLAEQNSLDLAWDLLMSDQYLKLRNCLFATEAELKRFRQVLVNVVLATDIFDPELNGLRKARWERAFSSENLSHEENNDLRATIVIEHIIQASDVSHTMQHWHIYRKWNRCLFEEMYVAYSEGRLGKNPAEFWYKGELGFFDNYVIPLAKKLKDCNVFGVSSDECLNYAQANRQEWETRGEQITAQMVEEIVDRVHVKEAKAHNSGEGTA